MIDRPASLALVVAVVWVSAPVVSAQCLLPGRPADVSWIERGGNVQFTWVPAGGEATAWTIVLTPAAGGSATTIELNDARSWGLAAVAAGTYDVRVTGRNACGAGTASEPVRIDTATPRPPTGIVLDEIGPFIEIVNRGATRVNLGGWRLYGSSGVNQAVRFGTRIDDLTFLDPGCSLLIGDSAREGGVPVEFAMPAGFGFSTTLALADLNARLVDEVGRDPAGEANHPGPFGEGTLLAPLSAVPLSDTRAYARRGADTNDNRADFTIASPPTPRNLGACREIPVSPSDLTSAVAFNSARLTWQFADGGVPIDGFQLEAGSLPGRADLAVVRLPPQQRAIQFDGVPAGIYYVRVRSLRGSQGSGASNEVTVVVCGAATCGALPGAPRNFVRRQATEPDVLLTWDAPAEGGAPTSYVIEAGTSRGAADVGVFDTGSTATSLRVANVPRGITFWVRIRARNATGTGPPSNELIVALGPAFASLGGDGTLGLRPRG